MNKCSGCGKRIAVYCPDCPKGYHQKCYDDGYNQAVKDIATHVEAGFGDKSLASKIRKRYLKGDKK